MKSTPYKLQRIALLPNDDLQARLLELSATEQSQLLELIRNQGLQFFWLDALRALSFLSITSAWRKTLKKQCLWDTARYMVQKQALIALDNLFERERIPYVIFKGAHIREIVYADPAYRPAVDIDLLVSPQEKGRVVKALCDCGYVMTLDPANINHEISLSKGNIHLDLHWHIMRPGRMRIDLTDHILETRKRCNFFWAPDNEMALLIMLAHPVFTKYSTAPQSSIVRLADLRQWLATQTTDWPRLLQLLENTGMKTAAWITATVLADLTGSRLPAAIHAAIRPPNPKRFLLKKWLDYNLSTEFANHPLITKYSFTLLAHDRLSDIVTFINKFQKDKKKSKFMIAEVQQAAATY